MKNVQGPPSILIHKNEVAIKVMNVTVQLATDQVQNSLEQCDYINSLLRCPVYTMRLFRGTVLVVAQQRH